MPRIDLRNISGQIGQTAQQVRPQSAYFDSLQDVGANIERIGSIAGTVIDRQDAQVDREVVRKRKEQYALGLSENRDKLATRTQGSGSIVLTDDEKTLYEEEKTEDSYTGLSSAYHTKLINDVENGLTEKQKAMFRSETSSTKINYLSNLPTDEDRISSPIYESEFKRSGQAFANTGLSGEGELFASISAYDKNRKEEIANAVSRFGTAYGINLAQSHNRDLWEFSRNNLQAKIAQAETFEEVESVKNDAEKLVDIGLKITKLKDGGYSIDPSKNAKMFEKDTGISVEQVSQSGLGFLADVDSREIKRFVESLHKQDTYKKANLSKFAGRLYSAVKEKGVALYPDAKTMQHDDNALNVIMTDAFNIHNNNEPDQPLDRALDTVLDSVALGVAQSLARDGSSMSPAELENAVAGASKTIEAISRKIPKGSLSSPIAKDVLKTSMMANIKSKVQALITNRRDKIQRTDSSEYLKAYEPATFDVHRSNLIKALNAAGTESTPVSKAVSDYSDVIKNRDVFGGKATPTNESKAVKGLLDSIRTETSEAVTSGNYVPIDKILDSMQDEFPSSAQDAADWFVSLQIPEPARAAYYTHRFNRLNPRGQAAAEAFYNESINGSEIKTLAFTNTNGDVVQYDPKTIEAEFRGLLMPVASSITEGFSSFTNDFKDVYPKALENITRYRLSNLGDQNISESEYEQRVADIMGQVRQDYLGHLNIISGRNIRGTLPQPAKSTFLAPDLESRSNLVARLVTGELTPSSLAREAYPTPLYDVREKISVETTFSNFGDIGDPRGGKYFNEKTQGEKLDAMLDFYGAEGGSTGDIFIQTDAHKGEAFLMLKTKSGVEIPLLNEAGKRIQLPLNDLKEHLDKVNMQEILDIDI